MPITGRYRKIIDVTGPHARPQRRGAGRLRHARARYPIPL